MSKFQEEYNRLTVTFRYFLMTLEKVFRNMLFLPCGKLF